MAGFATIAKFSIRTAMSIGLHKGIEDAGVNGPINGGIADASCPFEPKTACNLLRGPLLIQEKPCDAQIQGTICKDLFAPAAQPALLIRLLCQSQKIFTMACIAFQLKVDSGPVNTEFAFTV